MKDTHFKSNVHLHTWLHEKHTIVIISQNDTTLWMQNLISIIKYHFLVNNSGFQIPSFPARPAYLDITL